MDSRRLRFRIGLILTLVACLIGFYVVRLYKLQMVQVTEAEQLSSDTFTYDTTVTAARGSILDADGKMLVSNRASYNLSLVYYVLFNAEDPNGSLLELVEACGALDVALTDHLPITMQRPYVYDFDSVNALYESYFEDWLELRKYDPEMSAEQMVRTLRDRYNLPEELDDETARKMVGVRYELELRRYFEQLENYVIAYDVPPESLAEILELSTPGLTVQTTTQRVYHTTTCAHLLGHIGLMDPEEYEYYKELGYPMNAVIGQDGLEQAFEEYLHGTDGTLRTTVTANGEILEQYFVKEPVPGMNVQLTIDLELQTTAENALAKAIQELRLNGVGTNREGTDAEGGAVVVQEVATGRILACGSYPTYNLATVSQDIEYLRQDKYSPMYNRALSAYPPGSVFKMVPTIAMIDVAEMSKWYQVEDEGLYTFYEETPLRCLFWKNTGLTHGNINVMEALRDSCNYFFYEIGRLIGINAIDEVSLALGLGEATGIEIPENTGARANPESKIEHYGEDNINGEWYGADTLTAAIGQSENRFTPLQLCSYTSALAMGGTRYRATFLDNVRASDNASAVLVNEPEILSKLEISDEAMEAVREGMELVATSGTAMAYLKDYPIKVACKTGTAEHGGTGSDHASFVLYAPADNPKIAISVYVEKGAQGGYLANVAKEILDVYFAREEGPVEDTPENGIG